MAVTVLDHVSKDEMNWYHETRYWMHVSDMKTAERQAKEKGLAEGKAEGLAEGKAEGLAEGMKEAKLETARKMLEHGLDFKTIYEITGITKDALI